MSLACREQELDMLLAEELSPTDAERVRAHVESCAACAHALAWLKLERGWMAQRARRMPARPALSFEALEARLATEAEPVRPMAARMAEPRRAARPTQHRAQWSHRGMMAMGAVASVAFMLFGVVQVRPVRSLEEPWNQEVLASGLLLACVDPSGEAVAALEDRFGACLIASPAVDSY
ncbi:anti-sigma factor family protein [Hyalangium versicolor]|uniref:anti-sigma factor family protein n=1 Tax=Hyalangium versicolor TaxID=2861190 RepID=UPI001CCA2737|nr:zf-HC2 domain-containing protein [Hyalangium versicolor]